MKRVVLMLLSALLLLSACGSDSSADADLLGKELFNSMVVGGKAGCASCHSIEPGTGGVGPSLAGIGGEAAGRVAGVSAADYLRKSITDPNAYIVEGYASGVMPQGFDLTEEQLESLVEYLSGL